MQTGESSGQVCQAGGMRRFVEGSEPLILHVSKRVLQYINRRLRFLLRKAARSVNAGKSRTEETGTPEPLMAGDRVTVKSKEEIEATLDDWSSLRGCSFMTEMLAYCGTEQIVLKRIERFLDERDYRIKKARGLVILEGVFCGGTAAFGRCDRTCFFFWREEWLRKKQGC